ncbi:MAG: hypothetical protein Q4E26_09110 [Prevotellaceae bacterium]|nr:hypothetical protein [Prevotellaceae bacterium]
MTVKLKLTAIEDMLGIKFLDNKLDFCRHLKEYNVKSSLKTIQRAIEDNSIGEKIYISSLIDMCNDHQYPITLCFTFYDERGIEINRNDQIHDHKAGTITYDLLSLAIDISNQIIEMNNVRLAFNTPIDMMLLSSNNLKALSNVSCTVFIEGLMKLELDYNKYFHQDNFLLPFQRKRDFYGVSEDVCRTDVQYLRAYLKEKEKVACFSEFINNRKEHISSFIMQLLEDSNKSKNEVLYEIATHCFTIFSNKELERFMEDRNQ